MFERIWKQELADLPPIEIQGERYYSEAQVKDYLRMKVQGVLEYHSMLNEPKSDEQIQAEEAKKRELMFATFFAEPKNAVTHE